MHSIAAKVRHGADGTMLAYTLLYLNISVSLWLPIALWSWEMPWWCPWTIRSNSESNKFFFPFDEKITWNGKERNNYLRFLGEDALLTANRGATCFSMLPGSSSQIPSTPQDLSCHLHSSQLDWMSAIRSPNRWHKIHFRIKMRSCKISYWSQSSTLSSITLSTIASTVLSERHRSDSSRSAKTNSLSCLKEQSDYFN